jgi:hypothetical protein
MKTCYDCLHYDACSDAGDNGFSSLKEDVSKCKHFKNKADFVEVCRCKDCDVPHNKWLGCPYLNGLIPTPDFYCAKGTQKGRSDTGLIEHLNEEVDKIKRHGCIVPRVEMGTKDFLKTIEIINRQKAEIEQYKDYNAKLFEKLGEIRSESLTEYVTELERRLIAGGLGIAFVRSQMYKLLKEKTEGKNES